MCNRAGGLISRVVESHGIATVCLSINKGFSEKVRAPRSLFVKYPHGAALGEPNAVDQQMTVLRDLMWLAQRAEEPGTIVEPGYRWRRESFEPVPPESFTI